MDSFKVKKHKSAFCRVQLSVPDLLKDQIDNCPPHFQDESLKWAAAQKQNTPYSIFVVLCIVPTSQVFISPTVSQTHLINATSVTLLLVLSSSFKFTAIENDAPGFVCNFFSFGIETSCFFFGGKELFFMFGVQVITRCCIILGCSCHSTAELSLLLHLMWVYICNVSSSGKLFSAWRQQVESSKSTSRWQSSAIRIIDHLHMNGSRPLVFSLFGTYLLLFN